MGGYNPISYHCGSVWPHDNAIIAAGLMRYGFVEEAQRVIMGMLDAAMTQGAACPSCSAAWTAPSSPRVVSYPTSCSPQAWAAASPLLFLRTLLRFDPWVPHGKVWVNPALPEKIHYLKVDRIPLAGGRVSIEVHDGDVKVEGLATDVELITEPRHPITLAGDRSDRRPRRQLPAPRRRAVDGLGLTNWHLIREGASYFGQLGRPPLVRHLWSLAIELSSLPPLRVAVVARRVRTGVALLGGGIALSALQECCTGRLIRRAPTTAPTPASAHCSAPCCLWSPLDALATSLHKRWAESGSARWWCCTSSAVTRAMYPAGFLVCRLATVAVILAALGTGWATTALGRAVPRWLGTRSYSIYLWHWPLLALLRPRIDVGWPRRSPSGGVRRRLVLGDLSYRFVERPFLRSRRYVHPSPPPAHGGALVMGGRRLRGHVPLAGQPPVGRSDRRLLRAGQQAVAAEHHLPPTTTTSAPAATTTAPPRPPSTAVIPAVSHLASAPVSHVAAVPAALPPGPPPGSVAVGAIGDSVMLGAAGPLQARLGPSGYIDAKVSRQFAQGVDVARQMRDQGRLGQAVVVHLGTNGPPRTSDIDAMMNALSGVPHVLFLTVRMPRSWEAQTNQTLRATPVGIRPPPSSTGMPTATATATGSRATAST